MPSHGTHRRYFSTVFLFGPSSEPLRTVTGTWQMFHLEELNSWCDPCHWGSHNPALILDELGQINALQIFFMVVSINLDIKFSFFIPWSFLCYLGVTKITRGLGPGSCTFGHKGYMLGWDTCTFGWYLHTCLWCLHHGRDAEVNFPALCLQACVIY